MGGMNGMGGGGGQGTLQALLTELSGLKKPRGLLNRWGRRALGMRPKPPPKYRILVMMATNMPEALDEALLRPGRIDRIYRVGYPSKAGRVRTYEGYLDKVSHELTAEQIDKLATITPYATGATIKDLVNEALIIAIRDGREIITWKDVMKAKQLKDLGPPEDVEYIERERHAVAVHEACHAVVAFRTRQHMEIDIATIEKGSDYLGMVASIPPEDQFTRWRSEYESDILVSLASLAGERMFFDGDSSSGVSGDLESATAVASFMEGYWGMGHTVSSYSTARRLEVGSPGGGRGGPPKGESTEKVLRAALADRIEDQLAELLTKAEEILRENRLGVLALAHALETHKTLTGEDVEAVLEQRTASASTARCTATPSSSRSWRSTTPRPRARTSATRRSTGPCPRAVGWRRRRSAPEPEPVAAGPYAGYGYGQPQGYGAPAPGNGQLGSVAGRPGLRLPAARVRQRPGHWPGNGGTAAGLRRPGYPPPPPVPGWGRPEPGSDPPTQAYGPGQRRPPVGARSDAPRRCTARATERQRQRPGRADNGQTAPAAWYPTEPLHPQPDTGPVHVVGEPPVDTPPTGETQVGESEHREVRGTAARTARPSAAPSPSRTTTRTGPAGPDHAVRAERDTSGV